ncbi:MAG: epoxyqueuosine reductase QueH [Clostridiales bacterium]|nr:epoxyqueuosine reductase QueH [Clostridiales bacterium]
MSEILLHCCCGPCSVLSAQSLLTEGYGLTAYFHNPNIHPAAEYLRRRDSWLDLMRRKGYSHILSEDYPAKEWLKAVAQNPQERCAFCYESRLSAAAALAAAKGLAGFSTTLLISPYQKHELIKEAGERVGRAFGVPFVYRDFRPFFRRSQKEAGQEGLYRQKYCGCVYSEKERYMKTPAT